MQRRDSIATRTIHSIRSRTQTNIQCIGIFYAHIQLNLLKSIVRVWSRELFILFVRVLWSLCKHMNGYLNKPWYISLNVLGGDFGHISEVKRSIFESRVNRRFAEFSWINNKRMKWTHWVNNKYFCNGNCPLHSTTINTHFINTSIAI